MPLSCVCGGRLQNGKPVRRKNPGKMGKKMENGPRPEMAEKWAPKWKNGPKNGILGHFSLFFPFWRPFFGHFRPGAIFHFLSHFPWIFAPDSQKNPRVRKIRVRNSGAGNGCANFMDTWKNAFFLQENLCP